MIRAHRAALDAAIESQGVAAYAPGKVPDDADLPYAVVHIDLGDRSSYRLASVSDNLRFRVHIMFFGEAVESAEWTAERIDTALADVPLTVPGRDLTPCRNESSRGVALDDTDDPHLYGGSSTWTFASTPA